MNANELLYYLRGFTELVHHPDDAQWIALRNEILRARPVEPQLIPVLTSNTPSPSAQPCGGCQGAANAASR